MTAASGPLPVPLLVLGEARRERLRESVRALSLEWHGTWASAGVAAPIVEVAQSSGIRPRAVGRESVTLAASFEGELLLHAQASPDFARSLCTVGAREGMWMALGSGRSGLEGTLTADVVRALCESVLRAALPTASCAVDNCSPAVLEAAGAPWQKRAVTVTIGAGRADGGTTIELHLAPRVADALAGPRPKVARPESFAARRRAADAERVPLTVTLGFASVPWCDLSALAVGDAVLLDQELGAPCTVSVAGSRVIAEAHLGRADDSLAIQITRVVAAPAARTPSRDNRGST